MTGADLMRPNPLPQPLLNRDRSTGTAQVKDVQIVTQTDLHVTSIYAGGSGWAPHKIGEVAWDSAEFSVSLEGPDRPETTYRYGADVASGAAAAMFAVFLSALESGRPVDVASYSPGNDEAPVVLGVSMSAA